MLASHLRKQQQVRDFPIDIPSFGVVTVWTEAEPADQYQTPSAAAAQPLLPGRAWTDFLATDRSSRRLRRALTVPSDHSREIADVSSRVHAAVIASVHLLYRDERESLRRLKKNGDSDE